MNAGSEAASVPYSGSSILKHHILHQSSSCLVYGHTCNTLAQLIYTGFTVTWLTNTLTKPV